jgi:hypothetical protein
MAVLLQSVAFVSVCLTEACAIPGQSHNKVNITNNKISHRSHHIRNNCPANMSTINPETLTYPSSNQ